MLGAIGLQQRPPRAVGAAGAAGDLGQQLIGPLASPQIPAAPNGEGVEVYGPADAPLGLIRGRRRKRFLVRADRSVDLQAFMSTWRARGPKPPGSIRVAVDIDPYNFL